MEILYDFDYGTVTEENGRTVREWTILAMDKEFEIAPGIFFPGWVYGSQTSAASQRAGRVRRRRTSSLSLLNIQNEVRLRDAQPRPSLTAAASAE